MGITIMNEEDELKEEIRNREWEYKEQLRAESWNKFKYVCHHIIPSLINAIFDPTVRTVSLNIVRPQAGVITNNPVERKDGKISVRHKDMLQKALYFEELYRTWN